MPVCHDYSTSGAVPVKPSRTTIRHRLIDLWASPGGDHYADILGLSSLHDPALGTDIGIIRHMVFVKPSAVGGFSWAVQVYAVLSDLKSAGGRFLTAPKSSARAGRPAPRAGSAAGPW